MRLLQTGWADEARTTDRAPDRGRPLSVLRTGVGAMVLFATGYAAWSALLAAFPEIAMRVLSALFDGIDFGRLELRGSASLTGLAIGTGLWAVKGLVFGVVFAAVSNVLGGRAAR
jgi:hypothetical protein